MIKDDDCYFWQQEYVYNSERPFTKEKGNNSMDDRDIIELYWARSENAVTQTVEKYGRYIHKIAYAVLGNPEDSEECVNDTYIKVWTSIPPQRPDNLMAYIGRIVRNLSLDRLRACAAEKRGGGHGVSVLDELGTCVSDAGDGRELEDQLALTESLNRFLENLPVPTRKVFMRRYWYFVSVKEIAHEYHMTEGKVKMLLLRTMTTKQFLPTLQVNGLLSPDTKERLKSI